MNRRKFLRASTGAAIGCSIVSPAMDSRALASSVKIDHKKEAMNQQAAFTYSMNADPIHEQAVRRYSDWKFGMFIHWGQYSVASVEPLGQL
jgi:hypothetical protein